MIPTAARSKPVGGLISYFKNLVMPIVSQHQAFKSTGSSMLPTIKAEGDYLVMNRDPKFRRDLRVGDIVQAVEPTSNSRRVCKRVCGLPGDMVRKDPRYKLSPRTQVPPDHVWLLGDNLAQSKDSRFYGPVPRKNIIGIVYAKCNIDENGKPTNVVKLVHTHPYLKEF
ncbi:IMP1 inner mitochondrial membrane peptidase-like [Tieghemiomyces parasiticus]|uniref:IMP1 inner mitochondrial membrane peptidase-like n=1 Tax=Tieghemiomyces parasiticus TaxID=78921 RepID=A0A9W8A5X8_9FUNG|nr:IMP1 inner mitochondrial membrane peptidase-like [Tieghemiomyces parasiticus]